MSALAEVELSQAIQEMDKPAQEPTEPDTWQDWIAPISNEYDVLYESMGPEAWGAEDKESAIFEALFNGDWCELGRLIGPPAKKHIEESRS